MWCDLEHGRNEVIDDNVDCKVLDKIQQTPRDKDNRGILGHHHEQEEQLKLEVYTMPFQSSHRTKT